MSKKIKKYILFILILAFIALGVRLLVFINTPNSYEVRNMLLERSENQQLNTTYEKNNEIPYQILDGFLYYYGEEDGLYQYDYRKKEKKKLLGGEICDFQVVDKKIYYSKINDNCNGNDFDLFYRDMDNLNEKKVVIRGIMNWIFYHDEIMFCRYVQDDLTVFRYKNDSSYEEVVTVHKENYDSNHPEDLLFRLGDYLIFQRGYKGGYLSSYNLKTKEWRDFFNMDLNSDHLYFRKLDTQGVGNYVFIQGRVCDSEKSAIAGPYEVRNAKQNGIWQFNLITGEEKQLLRTNDNQGICVLDNKLYAIQDGKYEVVFTAP